MYHQTTELLSWKWVLELYRHDSWVSRCYWSDLTIVLER